MVQKHVKLPLNKILIRVLRKRTSEIITVNTEAREFLQYFPIVVVASNLDSYKVGDYVSLKPGKWEIVKLFGQEFMVCDPYMIDYVVTQEYVDISDGFDSKESPKVQLTAEDLSNMPKIEREIESPNTVIKGSWANKSKPN